jgi:hypothetical protein
MLANSYLLIKVLHVTAAIGTFGSWGCEWLIVILQNKQRDKTNEIISDLSKTISRFKTYAVLTLVGSGILMTITTWGLVPWIVSTIVGIIVMEILETIVTRYQNSYKRNKENSSDNPAVKDLLFTKLALKVRTTIGLGIVAVMTMKPASIITGLSIVATAVLATGIWSLSGVKKSHHVLNE